MARQRILVLLNASPTQRSIRVPVKDLGWQDGLILHNLLGPEEYLVSGDSMLVNLGAWVGVWIG